MSARQQVFDELLNSQTAEYCSAQHVRDALSIVIKEQSDLSESCFQLLSAFNDNHNRVTYEQKNRLDELHTKVHPLFKEVIYNRQSVLKWAFSHGVRLSL